MPNWWPLLTPPGIDGETNIGQARFLSTGINIYIIRSEQKLRYLPWKAKNQIAKSSRFKNHIAIKLPSPKRLRRCCVHPCRGPYEAVMGPVRMLCGVSMWRARHVYETPNPTGKCHEHLIRPKRLQKVQISSDIANSLK